MPPQSPPPTTPDPSVQRARTWAFVSVLGLIVVGLAWELWLAPTGSGTWAVKVLPLLLCIGGLMRHRLYTFRWLSLLVWLYFLEAIVRAITEGGWSQAMALLQLVLSLVLFGACSLYVRWRLQNGRRLAAEAEAQAEAKAEAQAAAGPREAAP
jgi:uncharacterized membrane protein